MSKTIRLNDSGPDVTKLQTLLKNNGYLKDAPPPDGIFEAITHQNVELFQTQHIDQYKNPLDVDGVVGPATWWALENASGEPQKNHFKPILPKGLNKKRHQLLEMIYNEHAKPIEEIPDGSNRSSHIDGYWGQTGVNGLPWCCAFVSTILYKTIGAYPINGKHHLGVQIMWQEALNAGMETKYPKPGDIFIQLFSEGKGHTGFVVGVSAEGESIYTGEGNCGNRLKIGKRKTSSINHFIDCINDDQALNFSRSDFDIRSVDAQGTR